MGSFMEATEKQQPIQYGTFSNSVKYAPFPKLDAPVCMMRLSDPDVNAEAARGLGMSEVPGLKGVYIGSPSWADFISVVKLGVTDTRLQPGKISVDGYFAFYYLIRLLAITSFLTSTLTERRRGQGTLLYQAKDSDKFDKNPRKVYYLNSNTYFETSEEFTAFGLNSYLTGCRLSGVATPFSDSQTILVPNLNAFFGPDVTEGHFFQYFPTMVNPDKDFVPQLVQRLFFRMLGETQEKCTRNFNQLRSGWRNLCMTPQGEALSHAFFGVMMAENGLASYFPVFLDGRYKGFVTTGTYDLLVRGAPIPRSTKKQIVEMVKDLNVHDRRLGEIVALIHTVIKEDGTEKYPVAVGDINTSRKLSNYWSTIQIGDFQTATLNEIYEKVDELQFSESYAEVSQKNLNIVLEFSRTGNLALIRDLPAYIRGGALRRRSNVARVLQIFGPRIPSISYAIGKTQKKFQIPKREVDADPNLMLQGGGDKQLLQYIPWSRIPFDQGVSQWESLFSTGLLRIPDARQGKNEFTNMALRDGMIGGSAFPDFYKSLRRTIEFFANNRDSTTGKRRGAGDVGEGPSVKRSKKDILENSRAAAEDWA
jgi:hypothetical protein